jgi:hypothetical protein
MVLWMQTHCEHLAHADAIYRFMPVRHTSQQSADAMNQVDLINTSSSYQYRATRRTGGRFLKVKSIDSEREEKGKQNGERKEKV